MIKRGLTRGQRILWRITRPVLILWLMLEFFRSLIPFIYTKLPHEFRSFMFDGYIDLWNTHIRGALPDWLDRIPTWDADETKVFLATWGIAFFLLARGSRRKNRVKKERGSGIAAPQFCQSCGGVGTKRCFPCGGTGHGQGGANFCGSCGGKGSSSCSACGGSGKTRR